MSVRLYSGKCAEVSSLRGATTSSRHGNLKVLKGELMKGGGVLHAAVIDPTRDPTPTPELSTGEPAVLDSVEVATE